MHQRDGWSLQLSPSTSSKAVARGTVAAFAIAGISAIRQPGNAPSILSDPEPVGVPGKSGVEG